MSHVRHAHQGKFEDDPTRLAPSVASPVSIHSAASTAGVSTAAKCKKKTFFCSRYV